MHGRMIFTPANRFEQLRRTAMMRLTRSPLAGVVQRFMGLNEKAIAMRNADVEAAAELLKAA